MITAEERLYQDLILERARAPLHAGTLACVDAEAEGSNPMCGDRVVVRLRRAADGSIAEIAHEGRGCAISLASADLMAEAVRGRDEQAVRAMSGAFARMIATGAAPADDPAFGKLRALAGVHEYRSRARCATLPWNALASALSPAPGLSFAPAAARQEEVAHG